MQTSIRTCTGRLVDLANFSVNDIDIRDINGSLNRLTRFNGHSGEGSSPLSIAQHSLLVYKLMYELYGIESKLALAHDFGEGYYGDFTSPFKKATGIKENRVIFSIDECIDKKFDLYTKITSRDIVKEMDMFSLALEKICMWPNISIRELGYGEMNKKYDLISYMPLFFEAKGHEYIDFRDYHEDFCIR